MGSLATIRRLSDEDVRAVFESVHNNHKPPPHLTFHVVRVGPDGLKLSPPSYEFEDGLYVLLRPEKKKKFREENRTASHEPQVPSNLTDLLLTDMPPSSCPWSLSGPQFPQPTAIQQRYCYPKGNPDYSNRKGGALWTMYGSDSKENLEYRLLHVYFSAKRAVNMGVSMPVSILSPPRPVKRAKKKTPPKRQQQLKTPERRRRNFQLLSHSPVLSFELTDDCFPTNDCNSPYGMTSMHKHTTKFVSPHSTCVGGNVFEHHFHPVGDEPSPFRPRNLDASSSLSPVRGDSDEVTSMDPFPWEETDETIQELEDACWDDPLFVPPSESNAHNAESKGESNGDCENTSIQDFANRLEYFQETVRDQILAAKESEQGPLLSAVSAWAREVARDPLGSGSRSLSQVTEV